ncbi:hypothetical protein FWK35_00016438 [Aphis craccivora]|uniref:Uncharacterized protein n=1 Tax=Aphis craccivora TaxID=307492 RepID=A0A6G0X7V2_APHCR|nr:hypothetical protein FWK35_00016438 [Aphis craccivora]
MTRKNLYIVLTVKYLKSNYLSYYITVSFHKLLLCNRILLNVHLKNYLDTSNCAAEGLTRQSPKVFRTNLII